jgi:hypothetical protein
MGAREMKAVAAYVGITCISVLGVVITLNLLRPRMQARLAVKRLVWIGVVLFLAETQVIAVAVASSTL